MRTFVQEYQKFKVFTDSLLSRNSKLVELISQLENELIENGKSENSPEAKRVGKPHAQHSSFFCDFLRTSEQIETSWNLFVSLTFYIHEGPFYSTLVQSKIRSRSPLGSRYLLCLLKLL